MGFNNLSACVSKIPAALKTSAGPDIGVNEIAASADEIVTVSVRGTARDTTPS
jgi:hypothetical protein